MSNSHEVITLEAMKQFLADARVQYRNGTMHPDVYVGALRGAIRRIAEVLSFAQDNGLEIKDGEETEAWQIHDRLLQVVVNTMRSGSKIHDFDLGFDRESGFGTLVVEPGSGAAGKPIWLVYSYDLTKFVRQQTSILESHNWDAA